MSPALANSKHAFIILFQALCMHDILLIGCAFKISFQDFSQNTRNSVDKACLFLEIIVLESIVSAQFFFGIVGCIEARI